MRERAIGLAVFDRRAVGLRRRVHQDRGAGMQEEPLVTACRRVALEMPPLGRAETRRVDEFARGAKAREPLRPCAKAGKPYPPRIWRKIGAYGKRNVEAVGLDEGGRTLRPFDHDRGTVRRFLPAKLGELGERLHTVEIRVHDRKPRQLVKLQKRESRAWHFEPVVVRKKTDDAARKRRFACAEIARKGDEIPGQKGDRDIHGKPPGRGLVRQYNIPGGTRGG